MTLLEATAAEGACDDSGIVVDSAMSVMLDNVSTSLPHIRTSKQASHISPALDDGAAVEMELTAAEGRRCRQCRQCNRCTKNNANDDSIFIIYHVIL